MEIVSSSEAKNDCYSPLYALHIVSLKPKLAHHSKERGPVLKTVC